MKDRKTNTHRQYYNKDSRIVLRQVPKNNIAMHGSDPSFQLTRSLTFSQTSPGFYMSAVQVFRKQLRGKEKLLVTSNFSFSHSVFYHFRELCPFHQIRNCLRQTPCLQYKSFENTVGKGEIARNERQIMD